MVLPATEIFVYYCHFSLQNKEENGRFQNIIKETKQEKGDGCMTKIQSIAKAVSSSNCQKPQWEHS